MAVEVSAVESDGIRPRGPRPRPLLQNSAARVRFIRTSATMFKTLTPRQRMQVAVEMSREASALSFLRIAALAEVNAQRCRTIGRKPLKAAA